MTVFKNPLMGALAIAALAMPALGTAATDGTLGATSEGSMDISVSKDSVVRISGLDDQNFGTLDFLTGDTILPEDFCVFSSTGAYNLTVLSANGPTFQMVSGANFLPYDIELNGTPVNSGTTIGGLPADSSSPDCNNTPNTTMIIRLTAAAFNATAPGAYLDRITLSVLPE